MDERRRFQIALGLVASMVLIAGLFVVTAPPVIWPGVPSPRATFTLPAGPAIVPVDDGASHVDTRRIAARPAPRLIASRAPAATIAAAPIAAAPARPSSSISQTSLPSRSQAFALAQAPMTRSERVEFAPETAPAAVDDERGPVTGAFVTAGREVSRGFRTAGRAIRAAF